MKYKNWELIIILSLVIGFSACTNSSDNNPSGDDISNVVTGQSDWKVSYYWDKDKDETNNFAGYTFHFKSNGVLEATRNSATTTGTWQVDNSSNKLIIQLGATSPLDDLNDDWIILEKTDKTIKLKDDNTDHTELLNFSAL